MEVISKQKIHTDVAFKQSCRPELERVKKVIRKMPKNGVAIEITSLSNYACLCNTDFQSYRNPNSYILHLHHVQLYETLYLEMTAHFQKVTETGPLLKQVLLRIYVDLLVFTHIASTS